MRRLAWLLVFLPAVVSAQNSYPPLVQTVTFAGLGTSANNGTIRYCRDCSATDPCTGSGVGSFALRVNGAWQCAAGGAGGVAPTDAQYVTAAADGTLSAERVCTDTATIDCDAGTAAQMKFNLISPLAVQLLSGDNCSTPSYSFTNNTGGGLCSTAPDTVFLRSTTGVTSASLQLTGSVGQFHYIDTVHFGASAEKDLISITPIARGAVSFIGTITSADLTANRTWTFPDATGDVAMIASAGFPARTSAQTWAARTITAAEGIASANGDGVAGNPTLGADRATVPFKGSGTADPPATCGDTGDSFQLHDTYLETDTSEISICIAVDTWALIGHVADDKVIIGTGTGAVVETIPDCDDVGGSHLNYNTTGSAGTRFSCGTSGDGAGGNGAQVNTTSWVIETDMQFQGNGAQVTGGFNLRQSGDASEVAQAPEAAHPSIVNFATGTGATNVAWMNTQAFNEYGADGLSFVAANGIIHFIGWVKFSAVSDGTDTYTYVMGAGSTTLLAPPDSVLFRYTHSANSGKWVGVCGEDSAETLVNDTGSAVAATTWYKLEWEINAAATSVEFFVQGSSIGTCATNIPDGGDPMLPFLRLEKTVGTTSRSAYVDALKVYGTFTTPR